MDPNGSTIPIEQTEIIANKLKTLGNSLRPVNDEEYFFFEILREMVISTITNCDLLVQGHKSANDNLVAWACRNLLEISVFTKYVLTSRGNARRFGQDRIIDGCDIARSLIGLELHCYPKSDTCVLDDWLTRMEAQGAAEGVTGSKFLPTSTLAEQVGMKDDFKAINRVCSKLVHPTAWSIISMNSGMNSFPQIRETLFARATGYICEIYLAIKAHNARQGMRPNP
jgi:hypothetical protein